MKHGMFKSIYKCNVSFGEICLMAVPKYLSFVGRRGSERMQRSGDIVTYIYRPDGGLTFLLPPQTHLQPDADVTKRILC